MIEKKSKQWSLHYANAQSQSTLIVRVNGAPKWVWPKLQIFHGFHMMVATLLQSSQDAKQMRAVKGSKRVKRLKCML